MIQSYDSHWAIDFQKHTNKFDYVTSFMDFYRALSPQVQAIDIVFPDASLTGYPIVFAPALNVLSAPLAQHLLDYVRAGGHLVLGTRSGMKNADDGLQPNRQPGPLAAALGASVAQFYALDAPVKLSGALGSGQASIWAEDLHPTAPDDKILLTYGEGNGWLTGHPAALTHPFGKGTLTYIAADLDPQLMGSAVTRLLADANIHPLLPGLPEGVELMQRTDLNGTRIWILLNHTNTPQPIHLDHEGTDLLTGEQSPPTELAPHDVAVWLLARAQ